MTSVTQTKGYSVLHVVVRKYLYINVCNVLFSYISQDKELDDLNNIEFQDFNFYQPHVKQQKSHTDVHEHRKWDSLGNQMLGFLYCELRLSVADSMEIANSLNEMDINLISLLKFQSSNEFEEFVNDKTCSWSTASKERFFFVFFKYNGW